MHPRGPPTWDVQEWAIAIELSPFLRPLGGTPWLLRRSRVRECVASAEHPVQHTLSRMPNARPTTGSVRTTRKKERRLAPSPERLYDSIQACLVASQPRQPDAEADVPGSDRCCGVGAGFGEASGHALVLHEDLRGDLDEFLPAIGPEPEDRLRSTEAAQEGTRQLPCVVPGREHRCGQGYPQPLAVLRHDDLLVLHQVQEDGVV